MFLRKMRALLAVPYLTITRLWLSIRQTGSLIPGVYVELPEQKIVMPIRYLDRGRWLYFNFCGKNKVFDENEIVKILWTPRKLVDSALFWWKWYKLNWYPIDLESIYEDGTIASVRTLGKRKAHGKEFRE